MKLKFKKIHPAAKFPSYAHPGDAGMDLYACGEAVILPGQRVLIPTGLQLAIPDGYVGLIWDKSGLAVKNGLSTIAGVIDAGFRGELKVAIINLGTEAHTFAVGEKIAQLLIQPVVQPEILETDNLEETSRGEDGFGSTGRF